MEVQPKIIPTQKGLVNQNRMVNTKIVDYVKARIAAGEVPDSKNFAYAIANSRHLLFNYLMDNNLSSINGVLKLKLNEPVGFEPNRKQIEGIISSYIQKNEKEKIQTLLDSFVFNPMASNYTTDEAFRAEIARQIQNQK